MNRFFKKLRRRRQLDQDLQDELEFHLSMSAQDSGAASAQPFGNATLLKEACREMWTFTILETWWQDIRYAARSIRNNLGVASVAVLALALGIGANTTVFTIVNAAFKFDLGVANVERLVLVVPTDAARNGPLGSYLDYTRVAPEIKTIKNLAAYRVTSVNVSDQSGALPERFLSAQMTAGGFPELRGSPVLGRNILPEDQLPDATPVVLLSHRVWQNRYGKDPAILGKTIRVDEVPRVVVGVRPPGMNFPEDVDLWTPVIPTFANARYLAIFGRLADGVKLPAARAEMDAIAKRYAAAHPGQRERPLADVEPFLMIYGVYAARPMFYAMFCAVGFVLLIVCADVANLLLARAAVRSREISIRIAIGAGRLRIIRQLLIESVLLAAIGGFFGWLVALGGLRAFDSATSRLPRPAWLDFSMNPHVFLYLAAISVGAGILFGLAPALRLAKVDVNNSIKDGGHGASGGRRGLQLSNLLVAFEMALCVILLAGAGLLIRSSIKLYSAPLGVNPSNVLTMHINLPEAKYPKASDEILFQDQLKKRLSSLPGVESVDVASGLPASTLPGFGYRLEDASSEAAYPPVGAIIAGGGYFHVMQVQPVRGRIFDSASDNASVVVNAAFAERSWPGQNAVGKRLRFTGAAASEAWLTVVGVVPNIQQNMQRPLEFDPLIYVPYTALPLREMFLIARTYVPPATLTDPFRRQVQALDENLPIYDVRTLDDSISLRRLNVGAFGILFTIFAAIALMLASVGLYAVMAHSVNQRTQEIGLRMALGGAPADIRKLLFAQGIRPIAWGLLAGLPLAVGVSRVLRGTLVGVSPGDPITFAGVILVLILAGALGCIVPARRATRVDPLIALRGE